MPETEPEFKWYTLHKLADIYGKIGTVLLRDGLLYFLPLIGDPVLIGKPDDPFADANNNKRQEPNMSIDLNDYNWREAISYASWSSDQVAEVIASDEGCNDGPNWLLVVRLADGQFSFLSAGCDYTGWDCQAHGHSQERATLEELIRFGMGQDDRERLGLKLPEPGAA